MILYKKEWFSKRHIAVLTIADELWYNTLPNGERKYSIVYIGFSEHQGDRLYSVTILGFSFRIGFIKM